VLIKRSPQGDTQVSQTHKTTARFDAMRLTYLTPDDARSDMAEWTAEEFTNTMYEPLFSVEDHSFSHAFGVEQVEHIECHDSLTRWALTHTLSTSNLTCAPTIQRLTASPLNT